jgi:hypothetical protein
MNSKALSVALFTLGLFGGYMAGFMTFQRQLNDLDIKYTNTLAVNSQLREISLYANATVPQRITGSFYSNKGHTYLLTTHPTPGWYFQGWPGSIEAEPPVSVQLELGDYE